MVNCCCRYSQHQETGFYYLQSRYYDPEIGRFLNIDNQLNGSLLGYNLFAYCENNPVKYSDYKGNSLTLAIAAGTLGELLFGVSVTAVVTKMIYDIATDIVGLLRSNGESENKESKPSEKEGNVTSKDPPTEADGYHPPKGGPKTGKTKSGEKGWVDDKGNIWVPAPTGSHKAHGGGHWDVNRKDGSGYINIYPGGNMRPGKGVPPVLQIIKIFSER